MDGAYALLAVLVGAALAAEIEPIAVSLRRLSAAILLLLALLVARAGIRATRTAAASGPVHSDHPPIAPMRAYLRLIGLTTVNPGTLVYFVALVAGSLAGAFVVSLLPRLVFVIAILAIHSAGV